MKRSDLSGYHLMAALAVALFGVTRIATVLMGMRGDPNFLLITTVANFVMDWCVIYAVVFTIYGIPSLTDKGDFLSLLSTGSSFLILWDRSDHVLTTIYGVWVGHPPLSIFLVFGGVVLLLILIGMILYKIPIRRTS